MEQLRKAGPELLGIIMVGLFLLNLIHGRRTNEAIAIKWAKTFCSDGQVLERNFAQLTHKATGGAEVSTVTSCARGIATPTNVGQSELVCKDMHPYHSPVATLIQLIVCSECSSENS